jgi:hypothetical protein
VTTPMNDTAVQRIKDGILATLEMDDQMNIHAVTPDGRSLGFVTANLAAQNPLAARSLLERIRFNALRTKP